MGRLGKGGHMPWLGAHACQGPVRMRVVCMLDACESGSCLFRMLARFCSNCGLRIRPGGAGALLISKNCVQARCRTERVQ
jgi:hypothetical protein